jgi:hypothetical protein
MIVMKHAIFLTILAIPILNLGGCDNGTVRNANEMAVIRELQFINTTQIQFRSQFQRYATTLAELGPLTAGDHDGYMFMLTPTPGGYVVHANPKVFGRSGRRTFYTDQDGLIRQNWSAEPANTNSTEFK